MAWINELEVCKRVSRSRATIRAWQRDGDLVGFKQGYGPHRKMFDDAEVDECARICAERYRSRPLNGRPPTGK